MKILDFQQYKTEAIWYFDCFFSSSSLSLSLVVVVFFLFGSPYSLLFHCAHSTFSTSVNTKREHLFNTLTRVLLWSHMSVSILNSLLLNFRFAAYAHHKSIYFICCCRRRRSSVGLAIVFVIIVVIVLLSSLKEEEEKKPIPIISISWSFVILLNISGCSCFDGVPFARLYSCVYLL